MAPRDLKIETALATLPLPGQVESGDLSLVKRVGKGTLIAVVDGLGHGEEAATAAYVAIGALDRYSREPLADLVRRCHGAMVGMRGVVLGLAYLDPQAGTMTWLGVGNIGGVLLHANFRSRPPRSGSCRRRASWAPMNRTRHRGSSAHRGRHHHPLLRWDQGRICGIVDARQLGAGDRRFHHHRHVKGTDDALVLVARTEPNPPEIMPPAWDP